MLDYPLHRGLYMQGRHGNLDQSNLDGLFFFKTIQFNID